ncbi:MAG: DUF1801 domain-containing protein [Chitinophagaceae bacterium]|nr:MAG: DUF1801 domain-containing protein [Chitinophagaceae bacterium]
MTSTAATADQYISTLPNDRKEAMEKLRNVINKNIPKGFSETMQYGMMGWVVPHSKYPAGYHCNPQQALPFASIASQKNFIALYHMGIYSSPELLEWFVQEYRKHSNTKLDMGKSCIRFKKPDQIPYELIGELMKKLTPEKWIEAYEKALKR